MKREATGRGGVVCFDASQRKHSLGEKRQKETGLKLAAFVQLSSDGGSDHEMSTSSLAAHLASAQRAARSASLGSNSEGPGPRIPLEGLISWGNKSSFGRAE